MTDSNLKYVFGPFTLENFNQQKWRHIKEKIYQLNSTNEEETIPDLQDHLQLLLEINNAPDLDKYFGEPAIKNFFFNDFMLQNTKNIIATKTFINSEVLELSNRILEEVTFLWLRVLHEDNSKLTDCVKNILDPGRSYFKINNQEEGHSTTVSSFLNPPTEEHFEWINSLKEGDLVDAIKIENQYKKMCWSHARVLHVLESHIKIYFLHDREVLCRYIEKTNNAHEIAPYKSRCKDFDWRLSIKKGDVIDVCDTSHVWYNATVLQEREFTIDEDKPIKEIYIGYRTYDENGDRVDQEGRRFFGWSSKYDEWLTVTNPRVAPKNAFAKKLFLGSSSSNDDPVIEDSNDRIYSIEGRKLYAITRGTISRSIFLVNLVNKLGERGAFEKILERISDPNNWAPIEIVSSICTAIGNIYGILHRDFAVEYIPKFKEAVWRNILKSPDSNIRNFNKDRLDAIVQAFDPLLKRVYSLPEKYQMLEEFQLEVCSICFESNFLERKLQGLKTLLEIIKGLRYGSHKYLTTDSLNKFIASHEIFDKIYGSKGHVQLVQRSADFLKYMINESYLSTDDLALVWNATTKGDVETKLSTYKVFSDISLHFKNEHLDFFIKKIAEIPPSDIIPDEIELVYELSKYSLRTSGFTKRARDFYWSIISDVKSKYSNEIIELTLNKFCDIMKTWELRDERIQVLYDCTENIQKDVSVLTSIRIMKKLIDHYPTSPATSEKFTKSSAIEHLCTEKNLLSLLIKDLKAFKTTIKNKVQDQKDITEAKLDALCPERATYITHISERLQFIHYILSTTNSENSTTALTYDLLSGLWDVIVSDALIPGERDIVYKWIKETAESKSGFPMSIEDLLKFFKDNMNNQQDSKAMTPEGFGCFKNVFLVINEKLKRIEKVESSGVQSFSNYHGGTVYYSYSYNHEDSKAAQDFEYRVNVLPEELEGIQNIWSFIMIAENEAVVEKAIDFLNKLYLHVSSSLEEKLVYMRNEYLKTCFTQLQGVISNKANLSESAFIASSLRCLTLIRSLMDESEKKGVGNLKSHSALVKGEVLNFNVSNDITQGADVPKKVELRLHANITVFELRKEVGKHFKVTWDQVKLTRSINQKEIKDNENGKTLGEIRIRNGETLIAGKRPTPPIPQANLILPDNSPNPLAVKIFIDWFNSFSENGRMSPEQCAAFIHSCTGDYCKADDKRVKEVFATYDTDRDGFLNQENWLEFYISACRTRPHVVWNNLHSHHYRNDLKKASEVEDEKIDVVTLARYIISTNEEYFKLIFSLLDFGGKIAIEAWKLLNRLPTSPQIFADIVALHGVRDQAEKKWNNILDPNSAYKMLYALHVIEYLMEDEGEEDSDEQTSNYLWSSDPKLAEYKKNWRADFIVYGGFDHLFKIFNHFALKDHKTLSIFDKNILSFILKIMKDYLTAVFASTVPFLYRSISFIRLFHLSLDFINDYINDSTKLQKGDSIPGLSKTVSKDQATKPSDPLTTGDDFKTPTKDPKARSVKFEGDIGPEQELSEVKMQRKDSKAEEKKKEKMKIEETEEFRNLVDRLSGELGNHIISTINLKDFLGLITSLGYDLLNAPADLESEDRTIIEHSLCIMVAIMLYDKNNIHYFVNSNNNGLPNSAKYILQGVFCSKSANVRRYFCHAIYILCKNTIDFENAFPAKHFISLFLKNLPSSEDDSKKDCNQYFELLCKLIEETYAGKEDSDDSLNFEELITLTIKQIKSHISVETRDNLHQTDKIFIGLLHLCEKILNVKPHLRELVGAKDKHNLVKELFTTCLYDLQERDTKFQDYIGDSDPNSFGNDYVKCKSRESRSIAYKLLITLCKDSPSNSLILMDNLKDLMGIVYKMTPSSSSWEYSPANDSRSYYGYAGIRNLGCICYMNAMLQQFFMTPSFRYGILMADDKKEPNWAKKDNKIIWDDNVLHQLQQMFGFLELTDRMDYNPIEFCLSFKDYSGQPVNVMIQQDTQEFLNNLFDKLETGLKDTPFKHITESVYGGKTSNQMICQGCGNMKERVETFLNMSLEVKNLKNLYESLDKYITGETIDDYFCDNCNKKNSINKRACVAYLPNVLIIHLQRIIFDLDTLMNQKINTRLEFPFELNMEPYTKEGLEWREKKKQGEKKKAQKEEDNEKADKKGEEEEAGKREETNEKKEEPSEEEELGPYKYHPKEYYEYKLVGVVVHDGTADVGHYYSFINTNRGDPRKRDPSKPDKWLEFNDSKIRDFDIKNIEKECYGGSTSESNDDEWGWVRSGGRESSRNAYILVYERVVKDPLKLVVQNADDEAYLKRVLEIDKVLSTNPDAVQITTEEIGEGENKRVIQNYNVDYYMLKKFVPARVYKKVWDDNHKFMFERHIYHEDFFKFIKDVCTTLKLPEMPKDVITIIHPEHQLIHPDTAASVHKLVGIISFIIFNMLARARDNNTIGDLAATVRNLMSYVPTSAVAFFDKFVIKDFKSFLELTLACPNKQVRYCVSQIVLHAINVMIAHYKLDMDLTKHKELESTIESATPEEKERWNIQEVIFKVLNLLITLMPTEVAKNWTKFSQFFEFWRDFASSGEPQMFYLYQKEFIAVLLDFYLEKRSPIPEFSEKKHSMGNKYTEPEFHTLLQTVAIMIRRAKVSTRSGALPYTSLGHQGYPLYDLGGNDFKCLYYTEFYEKTMREKYDPVAFGVIIQHLSFENEAFSASLAGLILKGLNRASYDDAKPYLEALTYFLNINDYVQNKRIEWILGFPQPALTVTRHELDSYGLYGNSSLDDVIINYDTTIHSDGCTSVINLILQNRKKQENLAIMCLRQILILANTNISVFEYIFSLPPPSYNYAKFTDWILPFIEYYLAEAKRYYYTSYPKEETGLETLKIFRLVEDKIEKKIDYNRKLFGIEAPKAQEEKNTEGTEPSMDKEAEKQQSNKILSYFLPPYIIGQSHKEETIQRKVYSEDSDPYVISQLTTEVYCYITESKPTGTTNLAFPQSLINDLRLKCGDVPNDSPLAFFIQPRGYSRFSDNSGQWLPNPPFHKNVEELLRESRSGEYASDQDSEPLLQKTESRESTDARYERSDHEDQIEIEEDLTPSTQDEGQVHPERKQQQPQSDTNTTSEPQPSEQKGQSVKKEKKEAIELNNENPFPEDFEFAYELNPVIRRLIIHNESPYNLLVNLTIMPKTNDFLNFRIPASPLTASVKPKSNACVGCLMKIYPHMAWGEYDIYVDIQKYESYMSRFEDSGKKSNGSGSKDGRGSVNSYYG